MHPYIEILKLQARQLRWTVITLLIVIAGFVIMVMGVYPGEAGFVDLLEVFQSESLQIFVGTLPVTTSEFYVAIWIQFGILSFFPIMMLGFGLFFGVELLGREQAESTFDSTFSSPQHRLTFVFVRLFGFLIILTILVITGILSTIAGFMLVNEQLSTEIVIQIWFVMGIQAFFGLALGFLIGSLVFDRSFGFQLAFLYIIFTIFMLLILNGIGSQLDPEVLNFIQSLSILGYLKSADILYNNLFDITVLYPIIAISILFFLAGMIIFARRDLNESSFRPFYVYFNPLYWIRRRNPENISKASEASKASEVPFSRYLIAWSRRFRNRLPVFVDDLWAHGMLLTIFALLVIFIVFFQFIFYPGNEESIKLLGAIQATPLFFLISGGEPLANLVAQPYLGYVISQYWFFLWIMYPPYFVYRFYTLETRDYNATTGDILWSKPISDRSVYLQRLLAILVEFYILILISIISFIIPDLIFGNSVDNIITQIILLHLTIPAFLSLGVVTSLLIAYFPKKKNIALLPIAFFMVLHLAGSLNPDFSILSQITPFYYFRVVPILLNGFVEEDFLYLAILSVVAVVGIFIRLRKKEHYIVT